MDAVTTISGWQRGITITRGNCCGGTSTTGGNNLCERTRNLLCPLTTTYSRIMACGKLYQLYGDVMRRGCGKRRVTGSARNYCPIFSWVASGCVVTRGRRANCQNLASRYQEAWLCRVTSITRDRLPTFPTRLGKVGPRNSQRARRVSGCRRSSGRYSRAYNGYHPRRSPSGSRSGSMV